MPASPPLETVAKIAAAEDALEGAVIDLSVIAMCTARRLGEPSRGPVSAINDPRVKIQARRLLLAAAMHLHGVNALFERQILGGMSRHDLAGAYDYEAMAEICDGIEDAAREEARDNRERMGDAP